MAWWEGNRLPVLGGVRAILCLSPLSSVVAHRGGVMESGGMSKEMEGVSKEMEMDDVS